MVADVPERSFGPLDVGRRGWVGVYLDVPDVDGDEVAAVVEDASRCVAPKKLLAELDAGER